jgi:hypothetical protein
MPLRPTAPTLALTTLLLAACAVPLPPAAGPLTAPAADAVAPGVGPDATGAVRYHCDDGLRIVAAPGGESVRIDGLAQGPQELLRDAGGLTPRHLVFSSGGWRAEFGLGDDGRTALLHQLQPAPRTLRCVSS